DPVRRQRAAMAAVGLADGPVESLVVHVVDAPAVVATRVCRREFSADELCEKRPRLLAVDDAGERTVLPEEGGAGVLPHELEKARLALSESEFDDGCDMVLRHQSISSATCGSNGRRPCLPVRTVQPRWRENPACFTAAA